MFIIRFNLICQSSNATIYHQMQLILKLNPTKIHWEQFVDIIVHYAPYIQYNN